MDNDNDFTFCKVGAPMDEDGFVAQKMTQDIGALSIEEGFSNGGSGQSSGFSRNTIFSNNITSKEATVGSLSFNVIDTSSPKQRSEFLRQEQKLTTKKSSPRAKVPFEKGYSQIDWLKLTRTHPDLAGLKGQSNKRLISMSEVKQHQSEGSMWTVLKGRVYNLSPYMKFHPGGADILMKAVGKDCTSLFNKYHAWVNAEFLLEKCLVGTLDDSK